MAISSIRGHTLTAVRTSAQSSSTLRVVTVAGAIAAADLGTKAIAEARLDDPVALAAGFELRLGHNSGVAFGFLDNAPAWLLVALVLCCGAAGLYALAQSGVSGAWVALALVLGGAVANLLDRISDGEVTDFLDPPRWPAFNVADVAITVGIAVFLLANLRNPDSSDAAAS